MSEHFIHEKIFYDTANYPHGFSRSGEFTIKESKILETYGTRLNMLWKGEADPETEAEEHFVAVMNGDVEPRNHIEKTWAKYVRLITEVKRVYILAGNVLALGDEGLE